MTEKKGVVENDSIESLEDVESSEMEHEEFGSFSKEELLKFIEGFNWKDSASKATPLLSQLKSAYDNLVGIEKEDALQKYIGEEGIEEDFEYKKSKEDIRFEKTYQKIKSDLSTFYSELEKSKNENLKIKTALLERLRKLISAEESNLSLNEFKEIQEEWKKTGQVPQAQSQELWNNYKALVDIFYNNRSIFFELKELDRKKNLEAKIEICEKVEKLTELNSVNQALKDLKTLHDEFKLVGPVPKEEQDSLWTRLKAASDRIYEKRKEYLQNQKLLQEQNLINKQLLLEKIEVLSTFESLRIDDWKTKTEEVRKIQEEWQKSGTIPQDKSKDLNAKFWELCKAYYKRKNDFFKVLDKKREENLQRKVELCEKVEAWKDAEDIEKVIRDTKELQKAWEKVGQVPIKQKDKIFKRFKLACDAIFNKKREQMAEVEKEYVVNLENKKVLISDLEAYINSGEPKSIEKIQAIQTAWDSIGFVPRDNKKEITDRYNKVMNLYIDSSTEISQEEKKTIRLSLEVLSLKSSAEGLDQLKKKEFSIKKKLNAIKSEIDQYNTNIEFFGRSKGAEKMREEIQANIDKLEVEQKALEQELKVLKS